LHKYSFIHAGFAITEGWYRCNNINYKISHGRVNYGGHAVVIVGADTEGVYIANSWGQTWGSKGFGLMPWSVFK
jgi:C1A family cysteine protease